MKPSCDFGSGTTGRRALDRSSSGTRVDAPPDKAGKFSPVLPIFSWQSRMPLYCCNVLPNRGEMLVGNYRFCLFQPTKAWAGPCWEHLSPWNQISQVPAPAFWDCFTFFTFPRYFWCVNPVFPTQHLDAFAEGRQYLHRPFLFWSPTEATFI